MSLPGLDSSMQYMFEEQEEPLLQCEEIALLYQGNVESHL